MVCQPTLYPFIITRMTLLNVSLKNTSPLLFTVIPDGPHRPARRANPPSSKGSKYVPGGSFARSHVSRSVGVSAEFNGWCEMQEMYSAVI